MKPASASLKFSLASLLFGVLALVFAVSAMPVLAQYTDKPFGAPMPDLGPSARPSGQLPASGLIPGTPARPPGEPGAGTYSPVNPLPNPSPVYRGPRLGGGYQPPVIQRFPSMSSSGRRYSSAKFCRTHPRATRCRYLPDPEN